MKDRCKKASALAMVRLRTLKVINILVCGSSIVLMAMALSIILTAPCTKETMNMDVNFKVALFSGLTDPFTLETSSITKLKETECACGQMVNYIRVPGEKIKCMEMEFLLGQMEENI